LVAAIAINLAWPYLPDTRGPIPEDPSEEVTGPAVTNPLGDLSSEALNPQGPLGQPPNTEPEEANPTPVSPPADLVSPPEQEEEEVRAPTPGNARVEKIIGEGFFGEGQDLAGYAVHLASFVRDTRAKKFTSELNRRGYPAFYHKKQIDGDTWFRVYVGPYPRRDQAQDASKDVQDKGLGSYFFIAKFGDA
jgi:cell division septation protein DedD